MPHDHADALLIEASTKHRDGYLTLASVGDDRRETQLDRRPVADLGELRLWLAHTVAQQRGTHEKLRLRVWAPGGRAVKGAILRVGAPVVTPPTPSAPAEPTVGPQPRRWVPNRVPAPPCASCAASAKELARSRRQAADLERQLRKSSAKLAVLRSRLHDAVAERDAYAEAAREGQEYAAAIEAALPDEEAA